MIYVDFDGVLFDSAREAFEVGCLAAYGRRSTLADQDKWHLFKSLRHIVATAWHYRSVFESLSSSLAYCDAVADLVNSINEGPTILDREFETKFFQCRKEWIIRDRGDWLRQSRPTRFFKMLQPMLVANKKSFVIVSTRNEESIAEILSMYISIGGLKILGAQAFSRHGEDKSKVILSENQVAAGSLFIDDGIEHIMVAKTIEGLVSFHALWGYVEPSLERDNSQEAIQLVIDNLKEA